MKKRTKRRLTRLVALVLTLISLASPLMVVFATNDSVAPRAEGISDTGIYMLRNKLTGLYLTIPQYTDSSKNVYQSVRNTQNPYALAVKLTYSQANGLYTISSVLYESLIPGRVAVDQATSNVYLTQESGVGEQLWHISYNDLYGGYIIRTADGSKALTAIGAISGSSSDADPNSYGNIALTNYIGASSQVWEIASVSPNAHIIKSENDYNVNSIEKKNINKGAEWLFQLRNSETHYRAIWKVEAVSNPSLVQIVTHDNYFIVKINENDDTPGDMSDNFALIRVLLDGNEVRYVMVQDAGTGNGDACRTMPFSHNSEYHSISMSYGENKSIMLTFKSNVGNIAIRKWEIIDDFECIEFAKHEDKDLVGPSYAVIKPINRGFAVIKATDTTGLEYTQVIEIIMDNQSNKYVFDVPEPEDDEEAEGIQEVTFEVQRFRSYLIKTETNYTFWDIAINQELGYYPGTLISWGCDYAVVSCDFGSPVFLTATGSNTTLQVTVTPAKGAIIIVPGIMASQIFADGDITVYHNNESVVLKDKTKLWDPNSTELSTLDSKVYALAMDKDGNPLYSTKVNEPIVNDIDQVSYGARDIYRNIYTELYNEYQSYGYDIVLFEYDWRYDPYVTAEKLSDFIVSNSYYDVTLVSHSMGGVVASYYISLGEIQRDVINKNISLGAPYLGSAHLLYAFNTGEVIDLKWYEEIASNVMGFYSAIKNIVHNIPSVYALLPYQQFFEPYLSYSTGYNTVPCLTYTETMVALDNYMTRWNPSMLTRVLTNQNRLFLENGEYITNLVNSYYIVGTGEQTINSVSFKMNGVGDFDNISVTRENNGDNTVTINSATVAGTLPKSRVFYKINFGEFESGHVEMAEGIIDSKTIDFVCKIIELQDRDITDIDSNTLNLFGINKEA